MRERKREEKRGRERDRGGEGQRERDRGKEGAREGGERKRKREEEEEEKVFPISPLSFPSKCVSRGTGVNAMPLFQRVLEATLHVCRGKRASLGRGVDAEQDNHDQVDGPCRKQGKNCREGPDHPPDVHLGWKTPTRTWKTSSRSIGSFSRSASRREGG